MFLRSVYLIFLVAGIPKHPPILIRRVLNSINNTCMLILRSHQHKQKNWLISSHEEFKIGQNDMYLQVWHLADQYRQ